MSINFDQKEYIRQININKRIEELELLIFIAKSGTERTSLEDSLTNNQKELQKFNSLLKKIRNRSYIKHLKKNITEIEENIEKLKKEAQEDLNKLNEELENLKKQQKDIVLSKSIEYDENIITITDSEKIPLLNSSNDNNVMVHCTNFFPKNKTILCQYDGDLKYKKEFENDGIIKEVEFLSHRHTVHFTINSTVKTTPATEVLGGKWEQPKFIIIEPLENHLDQFAVSPLDNTSDAYTYGSVKLGDKPILLVRDDIYNEVPKDEMDNFNIIKYKGQYVKCVNNLLRLLGYKLKYGNANSAVHSWSIELNSEKLLGMRNQMFNYYFNNNYDGKSNIIFNIKDLSGIFEIYNNKYSNNRTRTIFSTINIFYKISEETNIPIEFIRYIIDFGIYKNENNYQMLSDDEIYEKSKKLEKSKKYEEFVPKEEVNQIKQIYLDYLKYQQKQEKEELEYYRNQIINEVNNEENGVLSLQEKEDLINLLKKSNTLVNELRNKKFLEISLFYLNKLKKDIVDYDYNIEKELYDKVHIIEEYQNKKLLEDDDNYLFSKEFEELGSIQDGYEKEINKIYDSQREKLNNLNKRIDTIQQQIEEDNKHIEIKKNPL